jgi:hypothetical protein
LKGLGRAPVPPPEVRELAQGLGQSHPPVRMEMQGLQLGPTEAAAEIQKPVEIGAAAPRVGQERSAPGQQIGG